MPCEGLAISLNMFVSVYGTYDCLAMRVLADVYTCSCDVAKQIHIGANFMECSMVSSVSNFACCTTYKLCC